MCEEKILRPFHNRGGGSNGFSCDDDMMNYKFNIFVVHWTEEIRSNVIVGRHPFLLSFRKGWSDVSSGPR